MHPMLKAAIKSNQASFGYHWIYDEAYLKKLAKKESLLFKLPDHKHYESSSISYFAYPNAKKGDVTTQGMFLLWLNEMFEKQKKITPQAYEDMIYEHIKPGGDYHGYIETYGKKLIFNRFIKELNLKVDSIIMDDLHLVGFIPYLVGKVHGLSLDESYELAQIFTNQTDFLHFYQMFDEMINNIKDKKMIDNIRDSIKLAPLSYHEKLYAALSYEDTHQFIKDHAGTSCILPNSIPLIIHILTKVNSFHEMWELNTVLGGASSERGLILGAILSYLYPFE